MCKARVNVANYVATVLMKMETVPSDMAETNDYNKAGKKDIQCICVNWSLQLGKKSALNPGLYDSNS